MFVYHYVSFSKNGNSAKYNDQDVFMSQLKYVISRIRRLNIRRMLSKAAEIRNKTGRPRLFILMDMVWCGFRYQAGYMDYALFEMYNMNHRQRSTVLTRGKNNRYVAALNNKNGWPFFENKINFLKTFSNYIGRRWIDLSTCSPEAFMEFVNELGRFIAKPYNGTHGDGVELIAAPPADDPGAFADLYERLKSDGLTLCEEVITQHDDLNAIYNGSVNTIRAVSIVSRGEAHVVAACLRIGNGGKIVDNFNNGGMVVPIDVNNGQINLPAVDKAGNVYETHPVSGTSIIGARIPFWQDCLSLIKAAAQVIPIVRYVGWDIAVTPAGPIIVEGNQFPGHDIYGLPPHAPDKIGILPAFEAVVPLKSLNRI